MRSVWKYFHLDLKQTKKSEHPIKKIFALNNTQYIDINKYCCTVRFSDNFLSLSKSSQSYLSFYMHNLLRIKGIFPQFKLFDSALNTKNHGNLVRIFNLFTSVLARLSNKCMKARRSKLNDLNIVTEIPCLLGLNVFFPRKKTWKTLFNWRNKSLIQQFRRIEVKLT